MSEGLSIHKLSQTPWVIDTNVLLDLFIYEDPAAAPLRELFLSNQLDAVYSDTMLTELTHVIARPKFQLSPPRQHDIIAQWVARSRRMDTELIQKAPWRCKDRDDQIFLDMAFTLKPCGLLSKDSQVLRFHKRALRLGVNILSPSELSA